MKFAKLFETKDESQVLVTVSYNDDEDKYSVDVRTDFEAGTPKMSLTFNEEADANDAMDKYSQENADAFRTKMEEYF